MQQAQGNRCWRLRPRAVLAGALLTVALAPMTRFADPNTTWGAALAVIAPCLAMAVAPGLGILSAVGGWGRRRLTTVLALSIALSLPVAQAATVASLALHLPLVWLTFCVWGTTLVLLSWRLIRGTPQGSMLLTPEDLLVLAGLLVLSLLLYVKGTPFFADEFQIHVAVIRRFITSVAPMSGNLFPIVDVPYTHPFPSIHGLMGMISCLGCSDPLFVFHKLRFFWGPSSLLLLFVFAERFFGSRHFALASFIGAFLLTVAGVFADYHRLFWAQLATYSHPSDIAMNLHLPALLTVFLYFLDAQTRRSRRFFAAAVTALLIALTMTHIREAVQFVVYSGAFTAMLVVLRYRSSPWRRSAAVVLLGAAVCKLYTLLHSAMVPDVSNYHEQVRAELRELLAKSDLWALIAEPLYPDWAKSLFAGIFPLILLGAPLVINVFRRRYQVWLAGASLLAFLLLIRFPLFSIPYTYFTFWEILSTSVRNVTFFLYLLAGPALYLLAITIARIPNRLASASIATLATVLLIAVGRNETTELVLHSWLRHAFYASVIGLLLAVIARTFFDRKALKRPAGPGLWAAALGLLMLVGFSYGVANMAASPLSVRSITTVSPVPELPIYRTPAELLTKSPTWRVANCNLSNFNPQLRQYSVECPLASSSPPPPALIQWARSHLPDDARLAVNTYAFYSPSTYLPQAVVALPLVQTSNFYYLSQLMPGYLKWFHRAAERYRAQPFFNTVETRTDRLQFLRDLRVTHVLVDPMYYDQLKPILDAEPKVLESIYDGQQWAVYNVRQ